MCDFCLIDSFLLIIKYNIHLNSIIMMSITINNTIGSTEQLDTLKNRLLQSSFVAEMGRCLFLLGKDAVGMLTNLKQLADELAVDDEPALLTDFLVENAGSLNIADELAMYHPELRAILTLDTIEPFKAASDMIDELIDLFKSLLQA